MKVNLVSLNIPEIWKVQKNDFVDLEPDNDLPIDEVWTNFDEDIAQFTFENYFIDLGFYGQYLENRDGFFRVIVAEGDFHQGKLFENFVSRSCREVKYKIEQYLHLITEGKPNTLTYLEYGRNMNIHDYLFSATENIKEKLTDSFYEEIRKAKTAHNKT